MNFCHYSAEDVIGRVCYATELKDYFERFFSGRRYLKSNRNCNITSRVSGCDPGWACAISVPEDVDMKDFINIPAQTNDCQPCCEGFFCPKGLTCMIPVHISSASGVILLLEASLINGLKGFWVGYILFPGSG
ncbi:hypothetical protein HanHA300_Chr01g0019791 [Helianthus annuus]|nr:hypothetical protein HanHA300_Chr01g0019791 [Helianthus annuus]